MDSIQPIEPVAPLRRTRRVSEPRGRRAAGRWAADVSRAAFSPGRQQSGTGDAPEPTNEADRRIVEQELTQEGRLLDVEG